MKKVLCSIVALFLLSTMMSCGCKAVDTPIRVKWDVVYIPQNDMKSCATTSVAMAISYYERLNDHPLDKETVWNISGTDENTVYKYGNDMEGLKRIADYYGYKTFR